MHYILDHKNPHLHPLPQGEEKEEIFPFRAHGEKKEFYSLSLWERGEGEGEIAGVYGLEI
jgi:hypothetical protein